MKKPKLQPSRMIGSAINRELDALDRESSKVTNLLIAAGRGTELPSSILFKTDALSWRYREEVTRRRALRIEMERRYGPGTPARLPRGFGPLVGVCQS
jgi:hypothetical protein